MKLIKLKSPVVIKSCPTAQVGVPVQVEDSDASVLVGMGVAELVHPETKPDGLTTGRGVVETREPVVETRDPQPEPVKRSKKTLP